jgi:hypothetical protein
VVGNIVEVDDVGKMEVREMGRGAESLLAVVKLNLMLIVNGYKAP